MICSNCGKEIDDGSPFCYFCGESLSDEPIADEAEEDAWDKVDAEIEKALKEKESSFILTTTSIIEGYEISDYLGIVSAESSIGTGFFTELTAQNADFWGFRAGMYESKLSIAKQRAIRLMEMNAIHMGANALIGIDIDIMNTTRNIFLVVATGTAVVANKRVKEDMETPT